MNLCSLCLSAARAALHAPFAFREVDDASECEAELCLARGDHGHECKCDECVDAACAYFESVRDDC